MASQQIDFIKQGWLIVDTTVLALAAAPANSATVMLFPSTFPFNSFLFPVGKLASAVCQSLLQCYPHESVAMDSSGWRASGLMMM